MSTDIAQFIGMYPSLGDPQLQYELFREKEFHDLKLDRFEPHPMQGDNFNHQVTIERFLSNQTLYNVLLLVYGLGTGKTRISILVAEINRRIREGIDRRPLVLTRNKLLQENYKEELIKYNPIGFLPKNENDQPIDRIRESKRYKTQRTRLIDLYYEFETFAKLATLLSGREAHTVISKKTGKPKLYKAVPPMTDEEIKERFSHRTIIIDEAHNIRTTKSDDDVEDALDDDEQEDTGVSTEVYDQIHRLLHLVEGGKTLLMTATPIWDQPNEIASLMNLILPADEQLSYANFDDEHFTKEGKLKNRDVLRKAFFGRVSYVRAMQSGVARDYQGVKLLGGKAAGEGLKIFPSEMSKFEYDVEKRARQGAQGKGAFNIDERNAANFVFPDGTYRREGFEGNVEATDTGRYRFKETLDLTDLKRNLKNYSAKFSNTINEIVSHPDENAFVFFEFLKGSNAIVFGLTLELFGYKRVTKVGASIFAKAEKRYVLVSGETTSASDLIGAFNDKRNAHGDYIQVIIGTRKMAEGVTLKNVLQTHIMMPHWHTAFIDQAIGRTIRLGSHTDLNIDDVRVKIFLHAAAYKDKETIDIKLYHLSEQKDYLSAQVYREIKRSAFDCPLTYARNVHETDQAGTRDCEYQDCNYRCLQFPEEYIDTSGEVYSYEVPESKILTANDSLFYRSNSQRRITAVIRKLFRMKDVLTFEELLTSLLPEDKQVLLYTLDELINNRITLMGRFGFQSTLQENGNEYYLSERSRGVNEDESSLIVRENVDLSDLLELAKLEEEKFEIKELCTLTDRDDIATALDSLNYRTLVIILEATFFAESSNETAQIILEELRSRGIVAYDIDNNVLVSRTFSQFRKDMTKNRNISSYVDKLWEFAITYAPMDELQAIFDDLRIYVANRREANAVKKIKKATDKIEAIVKAVVKDDKVTYVHALFGTEPKETQYKRALHVTGLMRCYNVEDKNWHFCPHAREVEYVQYIKEVEKAGKGIAEENNPYGIYGTIDPHHKIFRIVEKGEGRSGFVCAQMSDKSKLIRIIISLRDKERELEGETSFNPEVSELGRAMKKEQLIETIKRSEYIGLEPLKKTLKTRSLEDLQEIEALMSAPLREVLCPLIRDWMSRKNLLVRA